MKKAFTIALSLFILLNLTGYSVYAHYCDQDLTETSLLLSIDESCCPDELPTSTCCNDEQKLIIIKDFFVHSTSQNVLIQSVVIPSFNLIAFDEQWLNPWNVQLASSKFFVQRIHPPDLNILFSVFLI